VNLERVITKLLKSINNSLNQLSLSVTSGNIDSMEKYKYIIGQITALEAVKQEISILLNDKEQNNGTVIDISKRDTKA
jgi:hypothetical protein